MNKQQYRGQTVLITVLVLTIALTVALSLMRRTTTDVQTTGQLEESARAFSAAEAGIEDILKRASGLTATIQGNSGSATFNTTYATLGGSSATYTYETSTEKGDVATVWLVPHNADNSLDESGTDHYCKTAGSCTLTLCWEQPSTASVSAAEIGVLYKTSAGYDIERFALDPDTTRIGNNFTRTAPVGSGCGKTGVYSATLTLPSAGGIPLALRLRPYYNKTTFSVAPLSGRVLPSQGFEVSSTGKTESGVTRKIVVKKKFDAPSSMFDYVLYAREAINNEAYPERD